MKQLLYCLLFLTTFSYTASAQKYIPAIKAGTVLNYAIQLKNLGQNLDLTLTFASLDDPLKIKWSVIGFGDGTFEVPAASLESAAKVVLSPPDPGSTTKIPKDQSIMFISKAVFKDMITNKAFEINGQKFTVVPDTNVYKINDKETDIIHATAGKMELWILNNPDFPIICQAKGVTRGIDFYLTSVN